KVVGKEDINIDITIDAKLLVNEVPASEGVTEFIMTRPKLREVFEGSVRLLSRKQSRGIRKLLRKYA
ncbi:MAG TPA: hypothetical protein VJ906_02440, partial [Roseovarius sp.]|nr:hypothetical protein [Roseovarius sp.]